MHRLGKKEHKYDQRTLALGDFIQRGPLPASHDFDKNRSRFPLEVWGNDEWGNCVIVGQAHQLVRLERLEQRRTLPITENDVVERYKALSGAQTAGDIEDDGLVMLDAMKAWRGGWELDYSRSAPPRRYSIAAYGELDPQDPWQLKAAIFLLHGIQFGFWLPYTAQNSMNSAEPVWDYISTGDWRERPGTWGGHAVFCKAYSSSGDYEILTWGQKVRVTQAFVDRYADEAWAAVDDFDTWRRSSIIDVPAMVERLREIGALVG